MHKASDEEQPKKSKLLSQFVNLLIHCYSIQKTGEGEEGEEGEEEEGGRGLVS